MGNRLSASIGFVLLFFTVLVNAQNGNTVVVVPLFDEVNNGSGIEYIAGNNISIPTPDPDQPSQQVISFDASGLSVSTGSPVNIRNPYLGLNYIIALQGIFPSRSGISEPAIGEITLFGGNFAPRSWAFCHGQLLPISQNTALFSILGTTYGGDGRTTLGLPDLRGRAAIGFGTGPGLPNVRIGESSGAISISPTFQLQ